MSVPFFADFSDTVLSASHFSDTFSPDGHSSESGSQPAVLPSLEDSQLSGIGGWPQSSSGSPITLHLETRSSVETKPLVDSDRESKITERSLERRGIPGRQMSSNTQALKNPESFVWRSAYLIWLIPLWIIATVPLPQSMRHNVWSTWEPPQYNATGITPLNATPSIENASVNFLQSMEELSDRLSLKPVDLLKLRELSGILEVHSSVQNSTETAKRLWNLADAVETAFNMMRRLHGKGHTETSVLKREFSWIFDRKDGPIEMTRDVVEHHYDTIAILSTLAASTEKVIRTTSEVNRSVRINLYVAERALEGKLKSLRMASPFARDRRRSLEQSLELVRSILGHTNQIAAFLHNNGLMINLYHDNAESWLDTVARRIHAPRYAKGKLLQCAILLDTLNVNGVDRQSEITMDQEASPPQIDSE